MQAGKFGGVLTYVDETFVCMYQIAWKERHGANRHHDRMSDAVRQGRQQLLQLKIALKLLLKRIRISMLDAVICILHSDCLL